MENLFFPSLPPLNGIPAALARFAVGNFIRPLGVSAFSVIGYKFGRKPVPVFAGGKRPARQPWRG
jgi:hypothetical protein